MSDLSFEEAEAAAFRRQAESLGADYGIATAARAALSDQLGFLRNNPAHIEEPVVIGDSTLHPIIGWACDDEAAIILGRLQERGWTLTPALASQLRASEKEME